MASPMTSREDRQYPHRRHIKEIPKNHWAFTLLYCNHHLYHIHDLPAFYFQCLQPVKLSEPSLRLSKQVGRSNLWEFHPSTVISQKPFLTSSSAKVSRDATKSTNERFLTNDVAYFKDDHKGEKDNKDTYDVSVR